MNHTKKIVFILFLFAFVSDSIAQMTFSVSPGVQLYGASFGYKMGKAVPFVGLQVLNATINVEEIDYHTNYVDDIIEEHVDKFKFTGTAIAPSIGLKYFLKESDKLKTYGLISGTTVILMAKIDDPDNTKQDEELQKDIKSLRIFGGQLGFGTEYFFDKSFSLGGEFGLRFLYLKQEDKYTQTVYSPQTGEPVQMEAKNTYKFSLNPTYVKLSLNYYFSGKAGTE